MATTETLHRPMFYSRTASAGVSHAADYLSRKSADDGLRIAQSEWLGGALRRSLRDLERIAEEYSEPGWDGYGALPVQSVTAFQAAEVLRALPPGVPHPEVSADARGFVRLEWFGTRAGRAMTVAVQPSGVLSFACISGVDDRSWGNLCFTEYIPDHILLLINLVAGR